MVHLFVCFIEKIPAQFAYYANHFLRFSANSAGTYLWLAATAIGTATG